jgi:hypothetical protein
MQAFELVVPGRAWHASLSWPCGLATSSHNNLARETYPVRAKRRWAVGALLFLIIRRQPSKHSDFFFPLVHSPSSGPRGTVCQAGSNSTTPL